MQAGAIDVRALYGSRILEIRDSTFVANGAIEAEAQAAQGEATVVLFCMNSASPPIPAGVEPDDACSTGRFTCAQVLEWGYGESNHWNTQDMCQSILDPHIFLRGHTLINAPNGVTGNSKIAEVCPAECSAPVVSQVSCFCGIAVYTLMAITECRLMLLGCREATSPYKA
jgi:hypothetical protein